MTLSWLSVDARTGVVLADLPHLAVESVAQSLTRYESTMAALPVPTAPENWVRATEPGGANLILLDDDRPIWGGMITKRTRGSGDTVNLSLATIEAYFDRRYVGDVTFTGVGQNLIVNQLITSYVRDGAKPGIPIRVEYTGDGKPRDREYLDQDDKTVYSALTDLAGVLGGPQWTVGWEHQSNPERYTPVLYVGDRIGTAVTPGLAPAATFEMPGPVIFAELDEDYSAGNGANDVMAVSTAQGTTRPQSPRQLSEDTDRPTFEYRFTPSTSISDVNTLTSYAQSALSNMADGSTAVSLTAIVSKAPRLGLDWNIGDDIGYSIGGLADDPRTRTVRDMFIDVFTDMFGASGQVLVNPHGRDTVPAFPGGITGVARAVGWQMTLAEPATITPILGRTL